MQQIVASSIHDLNVCPFAQTHPNNLMQRD